MLTVVFVLTFGVMSPYGWYEQPSGAFMSAQDCEDHGQAGLRGLQGTFQLPGMAEPSPVANYRCEKYVWGN